MPIKASILAQVSKTSNSPVLKKKPTSESSETQIFTESPQGRKHVSAFTKMEQYLCNLLNIKDSKEFFKERLLDLRIQTWAEKVPIRYKKWENLVRAGERLKELQFYAQSLSNEK